VNGKNVPSSAASAPCQDGSPLTETAVLSKLPAVHSDVTSQQQFKSPRLQQLLAGRTAAAAAAGSLNASAAVKSSDGQVPAENEPGAAEVGDVEKSDNKADETLEVAEV